MKTNEDTAPSEPSAITGHDTADDTGGESVEPARADMQRAAEADTGTADVMPRPPAVTLQDVRAGIVGALPVLWVLGAVPWRTPTLLIESMFRGFAQCAIDSGALNPFVMVCERAGVPLGMYQLDGGLSYPLGGIFVRLGIDPLPAWKLSVALLVVPGFAAMFWLGRRLTGSQAVAAVLVMLFGLGATMTARSWNWYWDVVAVALLPVAFAFVYVVFDRARAGRLRPLLWPGLGVLASVVLIGVEWQYAGMFATAVAIGAVGLLAVQRYWIPQDRAVLVGCGALAAGTVFAILRRRLTVAGVDGQFGGTFQYASENAIDLVSFVAPDGAASFLGRALAGLGADGIVVGSLTDGRQLWVAPYLGVLTLGLLIGLYVRRRGRLEANPRCPPGYLPLLLAVTVTSIVLSVGPVVHVAQLAAPEASFVSPVGFLWTSTPLRWIRYPWTWGFLTHLSLLLSIAVVAPALLRRGRSWSPLVWALVAAVFLELVSPSVLGAFASPYPSVATAPSWIRVSGRHPAVERFEAEAVPELHRALDEVDGVATLLPWGNTWITPYLGTAYGASVRNVGIDRNVRQVEPLAPFTHEELRRPTSDTVRQMLRGGWTDAVVLLDHIPTGDSILRHDHRHPGRDDMRWRRRVRRAVRDLARAGYCVEPHSWFTVITRCADGRLATR